MPASVDEAVGLARTSNPRVREAEADVDAAHALADSAKGDLYPRIGVDASRALSARISMASAARPAMFRRASSCAGTSSTAGSTAPSTRRWSAARARARYRLYMRSTRRPRRMSALPGPRSNSQSRVTEQLDAQSRVSDDLLLSYRSQFNVGRRSLLDVLDAQNTRYNVQVRLETARFSEVFARYQTLAATNRFLTGAQRGAGCRGGRERARAVQLRPAQAGRAAIPHRCRTVMRRPADRASEQGSTVIWPTGLRF